MASIFKRNGIWQVKFKRSGRWRYKSLKTKNERLAAGRKRDLERAIATEEGRVIAAASADCIAEAVALYTKHAEAYYRRADGTPTPSVQRVRDATSLLLELHAHETMHAFGPLKLKKLRRVWIEEDLARSTINEYASEIRRFFKWAVSEELTSVSTYATLQTVKGLRKGEDGVRESDPVKPVPMKDVEAVSRILTRPLLGLVRTQIESGSRGCELVTLQPRDFDTTGDVWIVDLAHHKTRHLGLDKILYFGPNAQAVLLPFLEDRGPDRFLFNPNEALHEKYAAASSHRRKNQTPTPRTTKRVVGDHYTSASYRRAIERACKQVNVDKWTPHRLRHNVAQRIRDAHGAEATQAYLDHKSLAATELYTERARKLAVRVARESG